MNNLFCINTPSLVIIENKENFNLNVINNCYEFDSKILKTYKT